MYESEKLKIIFKIDGKNIADDNSNRFSDNNSSLLVTQERRHHLHPL